MDTLLFTMTQDIFSILNSSIFQLAYHRHIFSDKNLRPWHFEWNYTLLRATFHLKNDL